LQKSLPDVLRSKVPFRYVEQVYALSPQSQGILADALTKGSLSFSLALQYLRDDLFVTADTLLESAKPGKRGRPAVEAEVSEEVLMPTTLPLEDTELEQDERDVERLAALLMKCYKSMPDQTALALARSKAMSDVINIVNATRLALESDSARSDFVILTLLVLFRDSESKVSHIIGSNGAFQKAAQEAGILPEK
jgi:hypothetical protein